jgi:hypothetical protein
MLVKTKENLAKPKITPLQLVLFGLLVGWAVITNLQSFKDLAIGWQLGVQIAFYVGIMLTAGQKGNISSLVRSLIGIIVDSGDNEVKMLKLQNLVVAMCQELGLLYEEERQRFFNYIDDTSLPEDAKAILKKELEELTDEKA